MGFVHHHSGVVLLGELNYGGDIGHIPFHREYAVGDDEFHFVGFAALKLFFKRCHVVVLILERLGKAKAASFDYRGMVLLVPQDIVFAAAERRYYSEIYSEACGINHHVLFADIFCKAALKLLVELHGAVEERRSGTSGAKLAGGFDGCLLDAGVVDKAGIAVAAEHQHLLAVDVHLGVLLGCDGAEIWINAGRLCFLRSSVLREFCL